MDRLRSFERAPATHETLSSLYQISQQISDARRVLRDFGILAEEADYLDCLIRACYRVMR